MTTIRILHHHEPGFGCSFDSPGVPGLAGGTDDYDASRAEGAVRFTLTCAAEEQGPPAQTNLVFEHYVPAGIALMA